MEYHFFEDLGLLLTSPTVSPGVWAFVLSAPPRCSHYYCCNAFCWRWHLVCIFSLHTHCRLKRKEYIIFAEGWLNFHREKEAPMASILVSRRRVPVRSDEFSHSSQVRQGAAQREESLSRVLYEYFTSKGGNRIDDCITKSPYCFSFRRAFLPGFEIIFPVPFGGEHLPLSLSKTLFRSNQ